MTNWKKFSRIYFLFALLTSLLAGISVPVLGNESASAAPMALPATDIVISEVRSRGSAAGNDDFIELYNPTGSTVNLNGWEIQRSNLAGTKIPNHYNFSVDVFLAPGQHYLIANTAYDDTVLADATYGTGFADDGGVALLRPDNSIADQVGFNPGTGFVEGTSLPSLTANIDQGYERNFSGCLDDGNNSTDFVFINPSDPQNSLSTLAPCTDLSLSMTSSPATPIVGSNVTFTITVSNSGPNDATNVVVNDFLPAGLTYVSNDGGATNTSGTVAWTLPTLANGSNATINVVATVNPSGSRVNRAEVWSSDQVDPDSIAGNSSGTEDDEASVTVTPPVTTGLSITNIVNNPAPNVGSNVVFTITVSNFSASNATGVQVNTTFPSGLVFVSSAPVTAAGDLNIGNLNSGVSMTFIITANVSSSGTKNFQATVSSNEFADATATATVNPVASTEADLSLSQTWTRSTAAAGRVDLKITVTNNETVNSATNVQVKDLLPSGLTYFSHSDGTYSNSTGIWAVGTLLPGVSNARTLTIVANVSKSGNSTTNFAEVWQSDQFDPDSTPGNGNLGEDDDTNYPGNPPTIPPNPGPEILVSDLSLTETVDYLGPIIPGTSNAIFSITVRNSGPDDAHDITVKNSKLATAANYTYVSHSSIVGTTNTPAAYTPATGDWVIPTLLDGQSATLTVTTTIVSPAVNWAQVSEVVEVDPDSLPANCDNTVLKCIEDDDASAPSADLSLIQSVDKPNPNVGDEVIFTIKVTNGGVAKTENVQVRDNLPAGLTYVRDSTGGAKYNKTSGIWAVGDLDNGVSQTLTITARVDTNGVKSNWAEVSSSAQADPDSTPGNGSITEDDDASGTITSYRSIIISEVAWSGTAASADDEWIELYNPSNASINIAGWTLISASGNLNITLSGSISSGAYFLLERDNNFTVSDVAADQIYAATSGLSNKLSDDGEMLILCAGISTDIRCGGTYFIDTANSEGSSSATNPWPKGSLANNYGSMERQGTSAETDKSWATNIGYPKNGLNANNGSIYGTPKKANSTGANPTPIPGTAPTAVVLASRIVINEFLPRPGFDWNQDGSVNVFDEFIEIKNIGNATGTISGLQLDDEANGGSNPYTLPSLTLKVGERMVFYGSQTNILLSDGGDTVRLLFNGRVYDAYTYAFAEFEDQSICRLPDGNGSWYEDCVPTPNLTNAREGTAPSMPDGEDFVSPVCELPDTLPTDFLFAECGGYGAEIWHSYYWDLTGWYQEQKVPSNLSKWESFVQ